MRDREPISGQPSFCGFKISLVSASSWQNPPRTGPSLAIFSDNAPETDTRSVVSGDPTIDHILNISESLIAVPGVVDDSDRSIDPSYNVVVASPDNCEADVVGTWVPSQQGACTMLHVGTLVATSVQRVDTCPAISADRFHTDAHTDCRG